MRAEVVLMHLQDVGAELDVRQVSTLAGHPAQAAPVETQSRRPRHASFPAPVEARIAPPAAWGAAPGTELEVRVHAIGCLALRLRFALTLPDGAGLAELQEAADAIRLDGEEPLVRLRRLGAEVAQSLRHAFIEPYEADVEPETYRVYVVPPGTPSALVIREGSKASPQDRAAVARLITGEDARPLGRATTESALRHVLQYYEDDAVVVGWDNALVVAAPGSYEDALDVMEMANLELLEFRTYDALLDRQLDSAFAALDRLWARGGIWRSARKTLRDLSALRVDLARLTDNLHDTGKVFGDWYLAKLHTHLRESFHLSDWERAVEAKVATLDGMFRLAEGETNQRRSMILEVMVVVLFVIDLVLIFVLGIR